MNRRVFNAMASALPFALWLHPAAAARRPRILAFGDSLTAGYGLPPEAAFPVRLEAALRAAGIDAEVVNGGVSGETTSGGLARVDWALGDKPDIVILELGANDMLRGVDPDLVRRNLDEILARTKAAGARPLLAGIVALANWGAAYERAFNTIYPDLAAKHGVPLYPFFLEGVALRPELNLPDGIHPSPRGVEIIVAGILPHVAALVAEVSR